jgi:hypothetical protein
MSGTVMATCLPIVGLWMKPLSRRRWGRLDHVNAAVAGAETGEMVVVVPEPADPIGARIGPRALGDADDVPKKCRRRAHVVRRNVHVGQVVAQRSRISLK